MALPFYILLHVWSQYFPRINKDFQLLRYFPGFMELSKTRQMWFMWFKGCTVRCCCNVVNFRPNPHKIHPIAHPLGRGMGCILRVKTVIYTLPQSLQWCVQYHVIFYRVIDWIKYFCKTRWAPCWSHEPCYLGRINLVVSLGASWPWPPGASASGSQ